MSATETKHESPMPSAYRAWLRELDAICRKKLSLSYFDLPDMPSRDAYEEGDSPENFFDETVLPTLREDYGSLIDEVLDEGGLPDPKGVGQDPGVSGFDDLADDEFASLAFDD